MINMKELYWLAGLIEGEGCFDMHYRGTNRIGYLRLRLAVTDRDVLEHASKILNCKIVIQPARNEKCKEVYTITLHNKEAVGWMLTLYSLMGIRRKEKIRELLLFWRQKNDKMYSLVENGKKLGMTHGQIMSILEKINT